MLATYGSTSSGGAGFAVFFVLYLAVIIIVLAGLWKTYEKAGHPGWAAIIPIYNIWILLKIVGRPGWWLVFFFIPFANFIVGLIVLWDLCKAFNKSAGWFFGLWLLSFIFFPMLGFGSSQYGGVPARA